MQFGTGCLLSPPDKRDYRAIDYIAMGIRPAEYMPDACAPILNQGSIGSCVAHALTTLKWYHESRERHAHTQWSTDYIYHNRLETDWQGEGMMPSQALRQLHKCGVCTHKDLSGNNAYPNKYVKEQLSQLSDRAAPQKIKSYVRCQNDEEICEAIYQHGAAIVTISVKDSFNDFLLKDKNEWVLPIKKDDGKSRGQHCVCAIGYTKEGIVIQNSWGTIWGYNGLAVLPYGYNILEAWSVMDEVKEWDIVDLKIGDNTATVNGETVSLSVPAQIVDGRTMVPLRFVSEALGADVEYIEAEKRVIIRKAR